MMLQTDQEFKQRNIEELNKKINVKMCSTHLRGPKAFAAEPKFCGLKKLLLRSRSIEKFKDKNIKPNELIREAMFNLNNTRSAKYGYLPEQIEKQALDPKTGKYFQEVYDFHSLIKVKENRDQTERFNTKLNRRKRRLREPLEMGRKFLVLAEHLRKKDMPGRFYKSTTENKRDRTFITSERSKPNDNTYLYWLKENGRKIKNRFLRQELFASKNQSVE